MAWGPYLWADGEVPRSDGLQWFCSDFASDAQCMARLLRLARVSRAGYSLKRQRPVTRAVTVSSSGVISVGAADAYAMSAAIARMGTGRVTPSVVSCPDSAMPNVPSVSPT